MQQWWSLILCAAVFLLSCSKEEAVLTFAVGGAPSELDYWEELIGEFEGTQKIEVKLVRHPTDTDQRRQNLVIPLKARERDPDVFLMDVAWVAQCAASDWLLPLDSCIEKDEFDVGKLFSSVVEQVDRYQGHTVALPVYIDSGLLYYRTDLLEKYELSVPETWEELVEAARTVQAEERKTNERFYGFVWQGAQYEGLVCTFMEFISSHGGGVLDEEGKVDLTREENVSGLQLMQDLIHEYGVSPPNTYTEMKEEEVRTFFESGNALFERNWPYAWKLHESEGSPIRGRVGVAVLPQSEGGRHAATLGGWHIGISHYADAKEQAWQLVSFVLSYDTQKKLMMNLGWNPGRKDLYDDPEVRTQLPHLPTLKQAFEHAVARPTLPYYTQVSEILQRYVNAVIGGKLEAGAALERAEQELAKLVEAYGA